jgi:hypothetical protein
MDFHTASRRLTKERSERKNRPKTAKGRRRKFLEKQVGQAAAKPSFKLLVEFLDGKLEIKPKPATPWLRALIADCNLSSENLALMMLAPLLDAIDRGWKGRDGPSASMLVAKQMGTNLRDRLAFERLKKSKDKADRDAVRKRRKKPRALWKRLHLKRDWDNEQCVRAGFWMMTQCAMVLNCFTIKDGIPEVRTDCRIEVDVLREELTWRRDQVHAPHDKPLSPWSAPVAEYDDRLRVQFMKDWRLEGQAAAAEAFRTGKIDEHARGVSALRRVGLTIDPVMRDLVARFAVDILVAKGQKPGDVHRLVSADVSQAKQWEGQPFWLDYNCDKRGRVNPVSHLNYAREDHVRSLFRFDKGKRVRADQVEVLADRERWARGEKWYGGSVVSSPLHWLEVHCANCEGSRDKKPIKARLEWVEENRGNIKRIGRDPFNTKELWDRADKPFAYVAACRELAAAMENTEHFVTHLPIGFDGSCNGLQHLALLCRDEKTAALVNLIPSEQVHDIYRDLGLMVRADVSVDDDRWADYWRDEFEWLGERGIRKLFKPPVMTFAYNVTHQGMVRQISEEYVELLCKHNLPYRQVLDAKGKQEPGRYGYLADKARAAAITLLPKPAAVMRYLSALAAHHTYQNLSQKWTSPTGFPVGNRYHLPNEKTVNMFSGAERMQYTVAEGCRPIVDQKAIRRAAPNFIHSMDATHLIRVVNAAADEDIEALTVHDCFACLAPDAERFNKIIRTQLSMLYAGQDHLRGLRDQASAPILPLINPPEYGSHDAFVVQAAKYCWA